MKLVSIVVPIYNVEKYLNKCIETLVKQSYKSIEIILVNDGSTDNSLDICYKWQKKDKRIKVLSKNNGGLSSARNYGMKFMNGEYVCFVDSDDYVEENMVEELYKAIEKDMSEISICNRVEFFEYKKSNNIKHSFKNDETYLCMDRKQAIIELCSFRLFDMSAWAKMYNSKLFNDIEFPEGKLSEDYYIMYKLFDKCQKIAYINKPLYIYNQRKGSISKNKKINYDYRQAAKEQMEFVEKKYPDLKKYVRTAYALSNMTIFNWYLTNRNALPSKEEYKELKKNVIDNLEYIEKNEKMSKGRNIQTKLFVMNRHIYAIFYSLYKKL